VFERFTSAARAVVLRARQESEDLRCGHVGTEHLLLALAAPEAGSTHELLRDAGLDAATARKAIPRLARGAQRPLGPEDAQALESIGIDLDAVLRRLEQSFGPDALRPPPPAPRRGLLRRRRPPGSRFTPRARKTLELALREALRLDDRTIGSEHLLLGLLREGQGMGARVLADAGVDLAALRRATEERLRDAA